MTKVPSCQSSTPSRSETQSLKGSSPTLFIICISGSSWMDCPRPQTAPYPLNATDTPGIEMTPEQTVCLSRDLHRGGKAKVFLSLLTRASTQDASRMFFKWQRRTHHAVSFCDTMRFFAIQSSFRRFYRLREVIGENQFELSTQSDDIKNEKNILRKKRFSRYFKNKYKNQTRQTGKWCKCKN